MEEAAYERSLGIGGIPLARGRPHVREGPVGYQPSQASPAVLPLLHFLPPNWRPQKPNRKWGGLMTHILIITKAFSFATGYAREGDVFTLKEVQSFDYYRSFNGLR